VCICTMCIAHMKFMQSTLIIPKPIIASLDVLRRGSAVIASHRIETDPAVVDRWIAKMPIKIR
ncbi:MAG TPA: hypothetical protein VLJ86_19730, partial [Ramlibacter sp.]|nr:hypothetical protein [Ramlibacter sp.]